jgi:hypothetical protein
LMADGAAPEHGRCLQISLEQTALRQRH